MVWYWIESIIVVENDVIIGGFFCIVLVEVVMGVIEMLEWEFVGIGEDGEVE